MKDSEHIFMCNQRGRRGRTSSFKTKRVVEGDPSLEPNWDVKKFAQTATKNRDAQGTGAWNRRNLNKWVVEFVMHPRAQHGPRHFTQRDYISCNRAV